MIFENKIRKEDVEAIIKIALTIPFAAIYRIIHPDLWLFSERKNEARDNGIAMFRYVCTETEHTDNVYLIQSSSPDADKVKQIGRTVEYGTLKHYFYYLAANKRLSSQVDADSPNSRVTNFLENHRLWKNKRVFLQHGITKDKISFGYYDVCKADIFVCAAKPEWEFSKEVFGYPEGNVQLLGFARFDTLYSDTTKKQILVMPTWRSWLAKQDKETLEEAKTRFVESDYYKRYCHLLASDKLQEILKKYNVELIFYPHSEMQPYVELFPTDSGRIKIANAAEYDIQTLIRESAIMITDYSSVAFDFAYMRKPIVYYHFDYAKYRQNQHPEGYFSYQEMGFGPVIQEEDELLMFMEKALVNDMKMNTEYEERIEDFFLPRDKENCKRIYLATERL